MPFNLVVYPSLSDPANITTNQRRKAMATSARRHQNDVNEDSAAPAISSDVLRSLVMSVTKLMTTAISNTNSQSLPRPRPSHIPPPSTRKTMNFSRQRWSKGIIGGISSPRRPKGGKSKESPPAPSMSTIFWAYSRIVPSSLDWKTSWTSWLPERDQSTPLHKLFLGWITGMRTWGTKLISSRPTTRFPLTKSAPYTGGLWAKKRPPLPSPPTWSSMTSIRMRLITLASWINTIFVSGSLSGPLISS